MSDTSAAALAYEEPSISVILVQASFLLLLNVLRWALDALLYCGLVGQILVGMAWGTPGAGMLSPEAERFAVQIGYLGLILLVYEGGLSTAFPSLRANIALSAGVAATGIAAPIGLSFVLLGLIDTSTSASTSSSPALAAFAAGAALCSTSLGTAFTVLRTSGLAATRLGVVLASAAMLDDVVGLVMVQVIASLGSSSSSASASTVSPTTIVRPVLVSVAFAVAAVLLCRFVVWPITVALNGWRSAHADTRLSWVFRQDATALVLHTALLVALVAGASYSGTSNLFAAYVAGAAVSWWDSEVPHCSVDADEVSGTNSSSRSSTTTTRNSSPLTGSAVFDHYYQPAAKWVLQPFFFASIGFSIPVTQMFAREIVWKGIVYAVLMCVGKLVCGLWLVRLPGAGRWMASIVKSWRPKAPEAREKTAPTTDAREGEQAGQDESPEAKRASTSAASAAPEDSSGMELHERRPAPPPRTDADAGPPSSPGPSSDEGRSTGRNTLPSPPKPLSLYPAAILGVAMVPRGEIGFLIAAVAQSHGVFGEDAASGQSDVFLVVTWAIVLCTLLGPPCVGLLVRRVRRLEDRAAAASAGDDHQEPARDVLGVWGVRVEPP